MAKFLIPTSMLNNTIKGEVTFIFNGVVLVVLSRSARGASQIAVQIRPHERPLRNHGTVLLVGLHEIL
jgi:hypothetical protein